MSQGVVVRFYLNEYLTFQFCCTNNKQANFCAAFQPAYDLALARVKVRQSDKRVFQHTNVAR